MADARAGAGEPFRPRLRWSVFLRRMRRPAPAPAFFGLPTLGALALTLFCFWQVFVHMGVASPAPGGLDALGAGHRGVVRSGATASLWMVLAAASAGLLALAMHAGAPDRPATLRPGAIREMAREAWAAVRARLPRLR